MMTTIKSANNQVAKLENKFIFHAHYNLTAREQKIILFLASNLQPQDQTDFHRQLVPVTVLESVLKQGKKKWGGLYDEMQDFARKIMGKFITFPSDFEIDGKKFPGYISWFQSVKPMRNKMGEVCLEFAFAEDLKPFLLQLREYVRLNRIEIAPMKSSYAIRIFSLLKAHRDKMRKHENVSKLILELQQMKATLGIADKYKTIDNFRRRVVDVAVKEINAYSSSISVTYKTVKEGRRVVGIEFKIKDKEVFIEAKNQNQEIDLSRSKLKAYEMLLDFGVHDQIALRRILPDVKGGGLEGFEDYFIEFTIQHFKNKSKHPTAATFVTWWTKDFFQIGTEEWSKIVERVAKIKKKMQREDTNAYDNRMVAKDMSNDDFKKWYRENN
jgi:plasmid replication initiation protein